MDEVKQQQQHDQLREFLATVNLSQFFDAFVGDLKVHSIAQIKYVQDEDLIDIGMAKTEIHRLMKLHRKHSSHSAGALNKLKKKLRKSSGDAEGAESPGKVSLRRSRPVSISLREGSSRSGLHAGLISAPQNDFRHTLHVGYDGTVFGDTACIDSDRLSMHLGRMNDDIGASCMSLPICDRRQTMLSSQSDISITSDSTSCIASIVSSDTLTDVSSLQEIDDDISKYIVTETFAEDEASAVDNDNLSDLTIPDFSSLDLGPSLVDEVMKMLGGGTGSSSPSGSRKPEPVITSKKAVSPTVFPTVTIDESHHNGTETVKMKVKPIENSVTTSFSSEVIGKNGSACLEETSASAVEWRNGDLLLNGDASSLSTTSGLSVQNKCPDLTSGEYISAMSLQVPVKDKPIARSADSSPKSVIVWPPPNQDITQNKVTAMRNGNHENGNVVLPSKLSMIGSMPPRRMELSHRSLENQLQIDPTPSSTRSCSSEFLLGNRPLAGRFSSSSSSSLPAKTGLNGAECQSKSKASRPSSFITQKMAENSDSETNILHRLRGKVTLPKFGGLRSSVNARTAKSGLPTENLNINVHFFDRLREQEMQNAKEQNGTDVTSADDSSTCTNTGSVKYRRAPVGEASGRMRSATVSPSARTAACDSQTTVGHVKGNAVDVFENHPSVCCSESRKVVHGEVARLSSRSVESHDSLHDSEHSSTTLPSDEGVYSDESITTSLDDMKSHRVPSTVGGLMTIVDQPTDKLVISDQDEFWTSSVDFREFVSADRKLGDCDPVAVRYRPLVDVVCYEDHLECELDASFDAGRMMPAKTSPVNCESSVSQELQLMSSVVDDVTSEDCFYALSETGWNVNSAIKLLMLRRLMTATDADMDQCKLALLAAEWQFERATWFLCPHPSDLESPDIVNV